MFTGRRWWTRYGWQVFWTVLALITAWYIRQTQGAIVSELYHWTVRPFQIGPTSEERLGNARIEELQGQLLEVEQQNQKLQNLLGYVETQDTKTIPAPIMGRSSDQWWQQVQLGRGKNSGITVGDVVAAPGGAVGRVTQVTANTSRVLLVSDPTSKVGVTISRSRYMGFLQGQGSDRAVMRFFDKVPDVREGDLVTTSTVSLLFPAGMTIGQVESINLEQSPAPEAIIKLTAPLEYLEWVVVHPFEPKKNENAQ